MTKTEFIKNYQNSFKKLITLNNSDKKKIIQVFQELKNLKKNKAIIFGNGGSAAISSHVSVDLTKNGGIKCMNFNESDLITCFSNDYGYSRWMEKSIDFYGEKGDLLILVSVSGKSKNLIKAVKAARKKNFSKIITFTGSSKGNPLSKLGDINFWIKSKNYNLVENTHQYMLLLLVDLAINF